MTSIIQTSVLRAAVLSAFDRGRYSVQFGTAPAGDDIAVVPASICLDLAERDDDLLGSEPFELFTEAEVRELRREVAAYQPESIVAGMFGADDHGPAVPAQDAPDSATSYMIQTGPSDQPGFSTMEEVVKVYEFALQDAVAYNSFIPVQLDAATQNHAPDYVAASNADWVHVYDRVTRERRTLKRPAEDKIIKGLADVAADLRGGASLRDAFIAGGDPLEQALASVLEGHEERVSKPGEWRVWRDETGRVRWERFAPAAQPALGPLTSAEGLVRGDVLWIIQCGTIIRFDAVIPRGETYAGQLTTYLGDHDEEPNAIFPIHQLAFVGRPDADGWMDWAGGENPVGDAQVLVAFADGNAPDQPQQASSLRWTWRFGGKNGGDIVRFRLVDLPALPSET